jgi:peptidoglycan hydrolase-like protein with peptidoglycan-binding domain
MQKKLVALKYMSRVSGVYDTSTINAVKAAQKAFGLTQSGVADDAFLHKLLDTQ